MKSLILINFFVIPRMSFKNKPPSVVFLLLSSFSASFPSDLYHQPVCRRLTEMLGVFAAWTNKQCICRGNVSPVPTFPSPSAAPGSLPPRQHCHWLRWPWCGWPLEQRRRHQRPPSFLPRCCCCWSFSILLQSWLSRSPSSKFKVLIWSDRCYLFQLIFILALHLFNLSSHLCLTLLLWRKPEEQVETLTSFITNSEIKFE